MAKESSAYSRYVVRRYRAVTSCIGILERTGGMPHSVPEKYFGVLRCPGVEEHDSEDLCPRWY